MSTLSNAVSGKVVRRIGRELFDLKARGDIFLITLYIWGCIGDRPPNGVPSESLFKDILFEWESTARVTVLGTSTVQTSTDQYSDEAHFHLDCKVNSQNLKTLVTWEVRCGSRGTVLLIQEQNLVHEQ